MCLPGVRGVWPVRTVYKSLTGARRTSRSGQRSRPAPPGGRLADRAEERRTVHEDDPADRRTAAGAGLALAAVGLQGAVEVPALAVDVDVERVERGAALSQRLLHHLTAAGEDPLDVGAT